MQFSVVVKGAKIFVGVAMQKFSARFLDKKRVEKIKAVVWGCGGIIPPQGARGCHTLARGGCVGKGTNVKKV